MESEWLGVKLKGVSGKLLLNGEVLVHIGDPRDRLPFYENTCSDLGKAKNISALGDELLRLMQNYHELGGLTEVYLERAEHLSVCRIIYDAALFPSSEVAK